MPKKTAAEIEEAKKAERLAKRRARRAVRRADAAVDTAAQTGSEGSVSAATLAPGSHSRQSTKMAQARLSVQQAFERLGGVEGLTKWGQRNPTEFYRLYGRMVRPEVEDSTTARPLEDLLAELAKRGAGLSSTAPVVPEPDLDSMVADAAELFSGSGTLQ